MSSTEYETPQSDGEFLSLCAAAAQQLQQQAQALEELEATLAGLRLARSVVAEIQSAAQAVGEAAISVRNAAAKFEEEYDDVRQVAARGMRFTGADAA